MKLLRALDGDAAGNAASYTVSINGREVAIESASYSQSTVTLQVGKGALTAGDAVIVSWSDLREADGQSIAGTSQISAQ